MLGRTVHFRSNFGNFEESVSSRAAIALRFRTSRVGRFRFLRVLRRTCHLCLHAQSRPTTPSSCPRVCRPFCLSLGQASVHILAMCLWLVLLGWASSWFLDAGSLTMCRNFPIP